MSINIYKLFFEQKDHLENDYYEEISDEVIAQEEKFGNLYKGRNVIWIGEKGRMVRASQEYTYPIDGNIFYDDKIQAVQRIIQDSNDNVYFYAPYGEASIITLDDIIESINYEEHNSHRAWTTDNEDLDEYIVNELDWIESNFYPDSSILAEDLLKFVNSNNLDAFREFLIKEEGWDEEDFKEGFEDAVNDLTNLKNLINEMEALKKEAVENNYGDLGEMAIQIRDGNHRTFGSFAAGEPYVWVMLSDNQMQDIKQEKSHVSSLSNIVESNTSGKINRNLLNSFRQKLQSLIDSGLSGFGGNCGNAAIEINNKVFDGKGILVAAVNKFIWEEYEQLVGHIAVYWPSSNTYWDIEGEKAWENIESWGMLDPEDDTWGEFLTEEDAYEVLRIELSEKDVRKHFDTCTYN